MNIPSWAAQATRSLLPAVASLALAGHLAAAGPQVTESRLDFRVISDSGDNVAGVHVLVEDANEPAPMDPVILLTGNRGVTGYCNAPAGGTYLAHLSEFTGGNGLYCGATYVVTLPTYSPDTTLGVHRQILSQNKLDLVSVGGCPSRCEI
ncbi:MAG: hypothetical protein AB1726_01920 [Planctomycetota bacterium]